MKIPNFLKWNLLFRAVLRSLCQIGKVLEGDRKEEGEEMEEDTLSVN